MKVLIVDDEASQRSGLAAMLSAWHMTPETAADGEEALAKLATFPADVILTDLNMPGVDGFGLLQQLRDAGDTTPTIVITAFGNIEKAVQTVHELGAYWFLDKPIQPSVLEVLIRRAGSHAGLLADKRNLERQLSYKGSLGQLVGNSPKMQEIFSLLQQAAPSKACVLITGESGTGKELVARTVHALSPRRQGPFIAINCAALPETLIESELFGHEKGSFTGASERRPGCFEIAQHGTLLLDEIGEMPLSLQVKLLRVLQEREIQRIGSSEPLPIDVRVIAASNANLLEAVANRRFREDLYYRLNVVALRMPALRDRPSDIPDLSEHFLNKIWEHEPAGRKRLAPEALDTLLRYSWPGNVRQLEHALESACALSGVRSVLLPGDFDLPAEVQASEFGSLSMLDVPEGGVNLEELMTGIERRLLERALAKSGGNKARAASMLHMKRTTLLSKFKSLEVCA